MKTIYKAFSFSVALLLLGACSNDNKWQPAPAEPETTGAYFELLEKYNILVLDENDHIVNVSMSRVNSEDAVTVPLKTISCPEGVTYPESVAFEAGQEKASFEINLSKMPLSTTGQLCLQIDPAYSTLYGAGTSNLTLDITVSKGWILFAKDAELDHSYSGNTYHFTTQYTNIYKLDKLDRFKIENFMNSGLDLVFDVADTSKNYSYIVPTTNCDMDYDDGEVGWYFYDTVNASYPEWPLAGTDLTMDYLYFDSYAEGSEDDPESYMGMAKGYGSLCTYMTFTNGKGAWQFIEINFEPLFDPFAEEDAEGEETE